jgi:hypothetical protein
MASGYSAARYDAEMQVGVEGPSAGDACTSAGAPRTNRGGSAAPRPAIPVQKDEGGLPFAQEPAVIRTLNATTGAVWAYSGPCSPGERVTPEPVRRWRSSRSQAARLAGRAFSQLSLG